MPDERRMVRLTSFVLMALLLSMPCAPAATTGTPPPQTTVCFLIDLSESFCPLTSPDSSAIDQLAAAVEAQCKTAWRSPVYLYWVAIADPSQLPIEPCGPAVTFQPSLLNLQSKRGIYSTLPRLHNWFAACRRVLLAASNRAYKYTDISGAIARAAAIGAAVDGQRLLFIYSDFLEDLPKDYPPPAYELKGTSVVLLYREPRSGESRTIGEVQQRVTQWSGRLHAAGASRVSSLPVLGLQAGMIAKALQAPVTKGASK